MLAHYNAPHEEHAPTEEEMQELATHLPKLTIDQLKLTRNQLLHQWGDAPRKEHMVAALRKHVADLVSTRREHGGRMFPGYPGREAQGERFGQPLEIELADRHSIVERLAQLTLEGVLHERHVLHGPRAVEAPLVADSLQVFRPRARLRHERHRIAGEADDEEDRRAQDEERHEAVEDAPDDELRHRARR